MTWLREVGDATQRHREERAKAFEQRAKRIRSEARLQGFSDANADGKARWHASRALGQRTRIGRVEDCGAESLTIGCQSCGRAHERPAHCGCRLLCLRCRGARGRELRVRFLRAREVILRSARSRGLLDPVRGSRRWGERFLTLTAPQLASDSVSQRIDRVLNAWSWFVRQFQAWQRDSSLTSIEWLRVFEWTTGENDHKGHPHLHLWIFSPFLADEMLRGWWAAALRRAGYVDCLRPVIKIKEVYEGPSLSLELIKYLTKDIDEHGDKIAPELYAEVYKSLDGRRVLQASRGFMGLGERGPRACEGCGASLPRTVKRKQRPAVEADPSSGGRSET